MDKKKAVKLATASAVAASAFVAANPHASQAATDVATVVSQAKAQFKAAYYAYSHTVTETGKLPNISDVYAAYNKAKQAYANAVAVVNKAGGAKKDAYLADLQATYETYVFKANPKSGEARVATYIDAYNYAVKLDGLRQDLAKAVEAKDLKKAEELYHKISYELKTRTVILDRVYGQSTRELLRSQFKAEAQKLRDSLIYDITVAMKASEAQDAVKAGNLDKAKAALDQVNQYVSKVTDAFKAELQKAAQDANAAYEAALPPKVESVTAVNAKTLEIKFNKAVDAATVIDNKGTSDTSDDVVKATAITLTAIDGQGSVSTVKASLSDDKKTLKLVADGSQFFTKRYVVDIKNVKTLDGKDVPSYTTTIDTTDSVRPSVLSSSYADNGLTLKVKFSEPLASVGTVKLYDGTTEISVSPKFTAGDDEMTINLASSSVPVNKDLTLKIFGAVDYNGNVINPNPAELTVKKTTVDTTKPTVQNIEAVNTKTVKVTFSEKLLSNPTIKIGGQTASVSVDSTGLVYTATLANALSEGVYAVEVSDYKDLAGNQGDTYTKVVQLKADTTAPKFVSSQVVKIDGVEHLVLTFDEEVTTGSNIAVIQSNDKYIDENNVLKVVGTALTTTSDNFKLYLPTDGKSKSVALNISSLPKGTYTVTLPNGLVSDLAGNPYAERKQITFVRGSDSLTTKPTLDSTYDGNGVKADNNNELVFAFTQNLDASALNLSNFNINGLAVTKAVFDGDTKHIRVTLAPGANTWTGTHVITISNIKNTSGLVMDTVTVSEFMKENVAPTFTATLTSADVIRVDFSEPVANATINNALSANNFTVKVDGNRVTVLGVYEDNNANQGVSASKGYKTVYLKLQSPVRDLSKPITLSATGIVDVDQTGAIDSNNVVGNNVSDAVVNVAK
ncbi:S-layer protein [Geobacillus sp. WSUCF1]|uniref:S-layer protein n=1 Tax=Geobacillus sp. WSUCF1 TaxID=886559 RepID=UPI0003587CCD|nr:S-layer protein [Geobacillus sp. WSUCF1]EPR29769.1 S-layer protein [Geobacillus sp. WSUCF1]